MNLYYIFLKIAYIMELILKNILQSMCFIISTVVLEIGVSALNVTKSVQMTKLERITAFDDSKCQLQDLLFSKGAGSLSRCAFMCMEATECLSMFYNQKDGKCHGCTARYSSASLPTSAAGFIHYKKEQTTCDDGWAAFQASCYKLSPAGTFANGVTYCEGENAHPVYIETSDENDFMKTFLANDPSLLIWYIGITDSVQNDVWRYYGTNELVNYLNFEQSQPDDDVSNSQQCGLIIGGYGFDFQWADHYCTDFFPTICEKDL